MNKWETITKGPFEPTWDSLRQYVCPDWFRDAKLFAIGGGTSQIQKLIVTRAFM